MGYLCVQDANRVIDIKDEKCSEYWKDSELYKDHFQTGSNRRIREEITYNICDLTYVNSSPYRDPIESIQEPSINFLAIASEDLMLIFSKFEIAIRSKVFHDIYSYYSDLFKNSTDIIRNLNEIVRVLSDPNFELSKDDIVCFDINCVNPMKGLHGTAEYIEYLEKNIYRRTEDFHSNLID